MNALNPRPTTAGARPAPRAPGLSRRLLWLLAVLLLHGGPGLSRMGGTARAGEPVCWRLAAEAQVDSRGIVLSQFVTATSGLPVPAWQIGYAPAPGRVVTLTRGQINEALARLGGPGMPAPLWSGAEQVRITRRLRLLEEEEVRRELTAALQREHVRDRGELELRFTRPWSAVSIADEPCELRVLELPAAGVTPNFIVRFELRHGRETLGQWQAAVQARIWREVWVAGSPLVRGQLAAEADLVKERRDVLVVRDALPAGSAGAGAALRFEDGTLELAENVAAGLPLTARALRPRPVIKRGKVVDAVVTDGAMQISVKVEALEDGLPGQFVRVRNVKSRREFRGKVQNEETVVVSL
jgi:flagella basal body P-ring formation protein FlgA